MDGKISLKRRMRVLVACEWSNTVRDAFLRIGHDAYSCDLLKAEHPNKNYKRHIRGNVIPLLREPWDLVIAHPPCRYLCNSGVRWITEEGRLDKMKDAAIFFLECFLANSPRVCVENPIMHKYAKDVVVVKPTQMIQPYQFGHPESKATYLWLIGLPLLKPTKIVDGRLNTIHRLGSRGSKERSRTFNGIAQAMADQWG